MTGLCLAMLKSPNRPKVRDNENPLRQLPMNKTTKLPDGSAFFTADIISKEEAMKLPLKERPICFRISSEMYHTVFESIRSASRGLKPRPVNDRIRFRRKEHSKVATE